MGVIMRKLLSSVFIFGLLGFFCDPLSSMTYRGEKSTLAEHLTKDIRPGDGLASPEFFVPGQQTTLAEIPQYCLKQILLFRFCGWRSTDEQVILIPHGEGTLSLSMLSKSEEALPTFDEFRTELTALSHLSKDIFFPIESFQERYLFGELSPQTIQKAFSRLTIPQEALVILWQAIDGEHIKDKVGLKDLVIAHSQSLCLVNTAPGKTLLKLITNKIIPEEENFSLVEKLSAMFDDRVMFSDSVMFDDIALAWENGCIYGDLQLLEHLGNLINPALSKSTRKASNYFTNLIARSLKATAGRGQFEVVQFLIEEYPDRLANLSQIENPYNEALINAARSNQLKIFRFLIEEYSDRLTNNPFITPYKTALMCAAWGGHLEIIRCLIEESQKMTKKSDCIFQVLMEATKRGHLHIIRYLIEEPSHRRIIIGGDSPHRTVLMTATEHGHLHIVRYLTKIHPDELTRIRNTYNLVLIKAAERGHLHIVRYLIEEHSDKLTISEDDNPYEKALERADKQVHRHIIRYLCKVVRDLTENLSDELSIIDRLKSLAPHRRPSCEARDQEIS